MVPLAVVVARRRDVATPAEGKVFEGWFENHELVSNDASYTVTVERARNLVAQFAEAPESMILTAQVNGQDWNSDRNTPESNVPIAITTTSDANGKTMATVESATKPTLGAQLTALTQKTISQGACSGNFAIQNKSWLVIGEVDGNRVTIEEVYDYSITWVD